MTYSILSAKGRLSRRDFALTIGTILGGAALAAFAVLFLILPIVFLFVSAFFRDTTTAFWILLIWGILLALCALYAVLPLISIPAAVRRLHDLNGSGFWVILVFVPLVNIVFFLWLLIKKGTEGDNDYGADPLAASVPAHACDHPNTRTDTTSKE